MNFESHPAVFGQLFKLHSLREGLIQETVQRVMADLKGADFRLLVEETLYLERQRQKRSRVRWWSSPYLYLRFGRDQKFLKKIQSTHRAANSDQDHEENAKRFAEHFAREICGDFNPRVYDFAIFFVPWMFSWVLNALSIRRFLPWKMSETLESRLKVVGEVDHLQSLAKKGTILLVPTHLSNIDSILLGYIIHLMNLPPFAYGAGLNLYSNPLFSFFMSRLGAYTVDRQKSNPIYKLALKSYSTSLLKKGIHSIFFPAGGRVRSGAIEKHLKLGLLGTALQAQLENLVENKPNPKVFVVPLVMNYHFVFEASSLVEDYLAQSGKFRFMPNDAQEIVPLKGLAKFFWKIFSARTELWIKVGKPLDVFGNFVDLEGQSLGPNQTVIPPDAWLRHHGEIRAVAERDREYTRVLGEKISERYHAENVILSSHVVAFSLFQVLRKKYSHLDLFRFLRLTKPQRRVPKSVFLAEAYETLERLKQLEKDQKLSLSSTLGCGDIELWIQDGIRQLGLFHDHKVVYEDDDIVGTEDMNLLYYYRNRLTGYGLGRLDEHHRRKTFVGDIDEQGFLV